MNEITIRNNPEGLRFEVLDGGTRIGQAAYVDDGDGHRIFYHTVIDAEHGGQGLAGRLAAQALEETVAAGLTIVPVCPYIKKYLGKHTQYAESTQNPTPALLAVLDNALAGARPALSRIRPPGPARKGPCRPRTYGFRGRTGGEYREEATQGD